MSANRELQAGNVAAESCGAVLQTRRRLMNEQETKKPVDQVVRLGRPSPDIPNAVHKNLREAREADSLTAPERYKHER